MDGNLEHINFLGLSKVNDLGKSTWTINGFPDIFHESWSLP